MYIIAFSKAQLAFYSWIFFFLNSSHSITLELNLLIDVFFFQG